jgi:hypothetical protein
MRDSIPEMPYEGVIKKVCGSNWRSGDDPEVDGAIGIAIVKSVADGVRPEIREISEHLGVSVSELKQAFERLAGNGIFRQGIIEKDLTSIQSGDPQTLYWYHGWASGLTGRMV